MEIIQFVPTGEVRRVRNGEHFKDVDGRIVKWSLVDDSQGDYPILERHEIVVPEGATGFRYHFDLTDAFFTASQCIPLPRRKVKKWRWERLYSTFSMDDCVLTTKKHFTEEEMQRVYCSPLWRKVPGTETE